MTKEPKSKVCTKCKQEKPITEFSKRNDRPCGRLARCKSCCKEDHNNWSKADRNGAATRSQRQVILNRKGMTVDQYESLMKAQKGVCAICGGKCATGRMLGVDHDHQCCDSVKSCGKCLRGLLCSSCNTHFAWFEHLRPAILAYAKKYK